MKIRRFFAPDMRRAIQLVRAEHGADAVILSSRAVDGGMEIISAVDYDEELIAQMMQPGARARADAVASETAEISAAESSTAASETVEATPPEDAYAAADTGADRPAPTPKVQATARTLRATPAQEAAAMETRASAESPSSAAREEAAERRVAERASSRADEDPSIVALRNELTAMRSMLCRQLAQIRWADRRMLEPERALLANRVARLGLDPQLAETLVSEVEDPGHARAWREVMYGLARRLDVVKEDPLDNGGVFALVGPTGVGKTTTIAKLAARHCLRYGRESLALISTDTFRIGAQRQLDAYGAILGVPVRQARGPAELERLLGALSDRRLVLIDTAGLSSRDRRLSEAMASLEADRRIRRLIVLAVTMQPRVMDEAVTAFGGDALAGAVLTKLDETDGLGAALSVLIRRKLTATWLSHGQRVPEDLRLARIVHLLRWALDEPCFSEVDDAQDPAVSGAGTAAAEVLHAAV